MLYVQIPQSRVGSAVNNLSWSDILFNQSDISKFALQLDQKYKGSDPLSTPKVFNLDPHSLGQHLGGSSGSLDDDQVSITPSDSVSNLG